MNKTEMVKKYLSFCAEHNLVGRDVVLSAGGALLALGLRESTSDLDVDVPSNVYDLIVNGGEERVSSHGSYFDVNEFVSLHRMPSNVNPIRVNKVWIYPLDLLIEQKTKLSIAHDRPPIKADQDKLDIMRLKALQLDFISIS